MPNIGSIDCYDGQDNFKHYFSANNIGLDYKSNDDTKKELRLNSVELHF